MLTHDLNETNHINNTHNFHIHMRIYPGMSSATHGTGHNGRQSDTASQLFKTRVVAGATQPDVWLGRRNVLTNDFCLPTPNQGCVPQSSIINQWFP